MKPYSPPSRTRYENKRLATFRKSLPEPYQYEVYAFLCYSWDVVKARWKISEWPSGYRDLRTESMPTNYLKAATYIGTPSDKGVPLFGRYVDWAFVDTMPDTCTKEPIILGLWPLDRRDHGQSMVLLNGAHRIGFAMRRGITSLPVITLSYDEMKAILVKEG